MLNRLNKIDLLSFINEIKKIAKDAGNILMHIYHSGFESSIEYKADNSPVTIADKTASDYIVSALQILNPEIPVLSEESIIPSYDERKKWKNFWLIDPLDGTKEFIKKNGEFTVNIALIINKKPVLGVVYAPDNDLMFWAVRGMGAYQIIDGKDQKMFSNPVDPERKGLKIVLSRSHLDKATLDFLKNYNDPVVINRGSSIKFMEIASGSAHIFFRFNEVKEWDTAASHIILKESGADMKNILTGKNIFYNKKDMKIPGFLVLNQKIR
ncbi:MAG: 3'(2'),5'-bisphosphate nucleotidase CysQ [Deltaproteobacteria bacterium]